MSSPIRATTDIQVMQKAMILAGLPPLQTMVDDNDQTRTIVAFYEDMIAAALSEHDWKFCTGDIVLARTAEEPLLGFNSVYQFPSDPPVLHVKGVFIGGTPQRYRLYSTKVLIDASETNEVIMMYQWREAVLHWPPYFTLFAIARCAAWLSASISRNGSLAEIWTKEAERLLPLARARDSQSQTTTRLPIGRFSAVRRGAR